ncbi:MAG: LicD family protein [Prevotella sp.]|jgi:lipopolysaccharide cholinephosphotransferase|nr:LicD family protein [Prevotella sp.]
MANYNIKDLQKVMLKTLLVIDKVCKEHHLRYYIIAGTLLGAIRHKGFIPWDDDADIAMPDNDYQKLVKNWKKWLPINYEIIYSGNNSLYPQPFAKIQDASTTVIEHDHLKYLGGAYVDIFSVNGVSDNKLLQKYQTFRYKFIDKLLYFKYRDPYRHGHSFDSWFILFMHAILNKKKLHKKIDKILNEHTFDKSNYVLVFDDGYKCIVNKDVFGEPKEYEFMGYRLMGVANYDTLLSKMYGNYMKIPPVENRRQHNFKFLDLNHPYRYYKNEDPLKKDQNKLLNSCK